MTPPPPRARLLAAVLFALASPPSLPGAEETGETGFVPLFDGHSLDGWVGQDMSFWSVEDGAITGTIHPSHSPTLNQYLVWQGGLLDDFELKLVFRLAGSAGTPNVNGGFQFRSRRLPNGDVAGYQVDNNFGQPWKARLYDEFGRHDLALQGGASRFLPDGSRLPMKLAVEPGADDFQLDAWHEYHLTALGPHLTLRVNGRLIAEVFDDDGDSFEPAGILALQLHTGPPMKAQFKEIRLKRLTPPVPLTPRASLLATASLHWQPGERPNAHQPPLRAEGPIEPGRPGARPGTRIARLDSAWFNVQQDLNAPRLWNAPGQALTVYARVRVPSGAWASPVFGKGSRDGPVHFLLYGDDQPATDGPDLHFVIRTADGTFRVSLPLPRAEANAWLDLVARYDGHRLQLAANGRHQAETPATGDLAPNDEPLAIGAEMLEARPIRTFTGELEDVALWTRALSDAEVSPLHRE